jgi:lichenan operon transcriptional antiterminator
MNKNEFTFQLIHYLCSQVRWTSSSHLAAKFHLSVRTIKTRIYEINDMYPNLIRSSNNGYKIDKENGYSIIASLPKSKEIPQNYNDRKAAIIRVVLMNKQEPSIEQLCDLLCISDTTLQKDINRLRNELAEDRLHLHIKDDHLSISGLTADKQKYILNLINSEIQDASFSTEHVQEIFTHVDLKTIQSIVTHTLGKYEYFLDNYSLFNYVLHLALLIELGTSPESTVHLKDVPHSSDKVYDEILQQIYEQLQSIYHSNFTLEDIYHSSILMISRLTQNNIGSNTDYKQFMETIDPSIHALLEDIIVSVMRSYTIDLREENFLIRFALHLERLHNRLENQISLSNLQFGGIKNDYPYIYAVSIYVSKIISAHFGYPLSEDEIGYIALHIGVLIEEQNAIKNKIHTVLICQDYNDIGKKAFNKLSSIFSDSILITNLVTSLPLPEELSQIDFIISSYPLPSNFSIPSYTIHPLISEGDIKNIFSYIEEIKKNKLRNCLKEKIVYFFKPDLFFVDESFQTDRDAIETLTSRMIQGHYVEDNYKELIYEHERICPSSYGNVAVPHPLEGHASSSAIAVSINPHPIAWGINHVHFVFMLSIAEEDNELFYNIFSIITQIVTDDKLFRKFLRIRSYDEFIETLINMSSTTE